MNTDNSHKGREGRKGIMKFKIKYLMLAGLALAFLLWPLLCLAQETNAAGGQAGVKADAGALLKALIPILVPLFIAGLKWMAPRWPAWSLPILAPVLGWLLDLLMSLASGKSDPVLGAVLGSAGVGVREVVDQLRGRMNGAAKLFIGFALASSLLVSVGVLQTGCSSTPQRVVYNSQETTQTSVEGLMGVWDAYVASGKATLDQERKVKDALTKYRKAALYAHDLVDAYIRVASAGSTNSTAEDVRLKSEAAAREAASALAGLAQLLAEFGVK